MRTLTARLALCALIAGAGSSLAGSTPVTARVWPLAGLAPSNILVEAYVEPDADNRELSVVVDSETFYSSSTIALNGAQAARATRVTFRMLPAGVYRVRVTVIGSTGPRGTAERTVELT